MYAVPTIASLAVLLASTVHASVYVTNPVQSSTCTGGQSCDVEWVDNGESPLLSQIGEADVALYTGEFVLVQDLGTVDVSTTSSFSFTVDPTVGPSGQYYLVFTSDSISYQGFSGSFTLNGMTGTNPGGRSSLPLSAPTTTPTGSSVSAGSTTPTGTETASAPTGTSTPVVGTTTPTGSTSAVETTAVTGTTTGNPTLTTPALITTPFSSTPTATSPTTTTTTTSKTSTTTSTTATATATNAAGRVGSSTSLGGIAALFILSGVFAF